jgi:hypothetical protein
VGYFCNLKKKLPIVNNRPLGDISPNLVTLLPSNIIKSHSLLRLRLAPGSFLSSAWHTTPGRKDSRYPVKLDLACEQDLGVTVTGAVPKVLSSMPRPSMCSGLNLIWPPSLNICKIRLWLSINLYRYVGDFYLNPGKLWGFKVSSKKNRLLEQ